ncbi:MAG: SDR family oxidoreductase, partial [Planctomycetes bacterium]|nr:SDR family oxidoreductase [Planctomycetota bacterium]
MIDLTGKHILIIGGSRGIGAETARIAARAGANISVTYLSRSDAADAVIKDVTDAGSQGTAIQADVSSEEGVNKAVSEAIAAHGELNGIAIAAGIFEGALIEDMDIDFWDRTMDINLRGTFLAVRAAKDSLKKSGNGSIVIFTSTAGQRGSDLFSAYATSKGGQIMFMRSMARELAPANIRSNCVAPGWTETEMATQMIDKFGREDIVNSIPLGRIGRPEDPASAAVFLLSDAAQFITGSPITVDG